MLLSMVASAEVRLLTSHGKGRTSASGAIARRTKNEPEVVIVEPPRESLDPWEKWLAAGSCTSPERRLGPAGPEFPRKLFQRW